MVRMTEKTILIIEDDANIRDTLKTALELEDYDIHLAENGKEGFNVLESGVRPGLILLDLMMPVMNGWEFIKEIKKFKDYSDIPIVVVSAFVDRAKGLDCDDFVLKPLELNHLIDTVKDNMK